MLPAGQGPTLWFTNLGLIRHTPPRTHARTTVGHFLNSSQHGGHFEKIISCVLVIHQEDIIYKKVCQIAVICFSTAGHFENSCQHGGHFEK